MFGVTSIFKLDWYLLYDTVTAVPIKLILVSITAPSSTFLFAFQIANNDVNVTNGTNDNENMLLQSSLNSIMTIATNPTYISNTITNIVNNILITSCFLFIMSPYNSYIN